MGFSANKKAAYQRVAAAVITWLSCAKLVGITYFSAKGTHTRYCAMTGTTPVTATTASG
jgi:hypothetical protein